MASSSQDKSLRLWDANSLLELRLVRWGSRNNIDNALAFSSDSRFLMGVTERTGVHVYEVAVAARNNTKSFRRYNGSAHAVAFSPDGTVVAWGQQDGLVKLAPFRPEQGNPKGPQ